MPPPARVHPSGGLKTNGRPPRPQNIIPSSGKEVILPDLVSAPPPTPAPSSASWRALGSSSRSQSNVIGSQKEVLGPDSVDTAVQSFLYRENYIWKELDKYLQHQELLNLRRQELLHKQWFESVSRPLLSAVSQKIESQSSRDIERRRQVQLAEYLKYQKEKGTLFLEQYDPEEYDPFQHKKLGQLEESCIRFKSTKTSLKLGGDYGGCSGSGGGENRSGQSLHQGQHPLRSRP
ncbi:protein FAM228B [Ornithorhynchus anatinus]|uniref:Family with sequence similarity 228 member B n=1 Tax=Ornithorhynchus anatinus TaxID=9258 RepID=A0A6I8PCW3_ORNAN|nr:protein FAM228B [Ornithorhynchus anatinus]